MSEEATLDKFLQDEPEEEGEAEWSESKLENLLSELLTGSRPTGGGLDEGEYISIGGTQVNSEGHLSLHDLVYIPEDYFERVRETQLQKHDILVVKDGANTGDVAIAWESDDRIVTNEHLFTLRSDSSINSPYLFYFLLSHKGWKQINGTITGSAQEGINRGFTGKVDIQYPSLSEQRKIATVLYTVDRAIDNIEKLVRQTERVKAGLTQDLLKNGINNQQMVETDSRFGLLPESWELQPLKKVGEIAGRTAPEKDDTECWGGDIPWATPSEITSLVGQTIEDTEEYLTELALEKVSSNLLPPMSVLMTTRATIGECAVNTVEMTTNQGFKNVIPGKRLDTWYTYYRLDYEKDYLASLSKGSTFPEVGKDTVENFVIPIPPLEEQRKIGEKLRSVGKQILSYKENKSQYERLKRALMQDLLSGTVRTTDTNIEVPEEVA